MHTCIGRRRCPQPRRCIATDERKWCRPCRRLHTSTVPRVLAIRSAARRDFAPFCLCDSIWFHYITSLYTNNFIYNKPLSKHDHKVLYSKNKEEQWNNSLLVTTCHKHRCCNSFVINPSRLKHRSIIWILFTALKIGHSIPQNKATYITWKTKKILFVQPCLLNITFLCN